MLSRSCCIIILFVILSLTCEKTEVTDKSETYEQHKITKYVAVLLFTILVLYGFASNIFMATVLFCRKRNNRYNREFILIASQIIICDFMALFPHIIVVLPEIILRGKKNFYANETTWINRTFSTLATFPFFSILHFSFLLTLNRFVALILPKCSPFFKSTKLYILIAIVWLSILVFTIADFHYCTTEFLVSKLRWEGDCEKSNGARGTWWRIRFFWALFVPNVMFVMYVAIFYNIRRKHQKITRMRTGYKINAATVYNYEWSILFHAIWNCGILEASTIIFYFLPSLSMKIFGEAADIPSNIFINCYFIFVCSTLPTGYFIYSKQSYDLIKRLRHWLHLKIEQLKRIVPVGS